MYLDHDEASGSWVGTLLLRAERDGAAEGRVDPVVCEVMDGRGNAVTASCVVVVPHDKRR